MTMWSPICLAWLSELSLWLAEIVGEDAPVDPLHKKAVLQILDPRGIFDLERLVQNLKDLFRIHNMCTLHGYCSILWEISVTFN
ncbi:MAG: hypothetical protein MPW15_11980 [Candidatus Manganitrophus sp.]|nr:hypothetical protein [Candidatus Manganitrophus sp.]